MRVCPHCHLLFGDAEASCPHDRTATGPASVPTPAPALAARFSDIVPFAQSPTGTSYRAFHKQSGQPGLLKLVPLAPLEAAERVRLKRELRKQTKLTHDGLARIIDGGEQGQDLWLFRELLSGETVAQRLSRLGRLPVAEALAVTAQVATGLDELQRGGLLHRDVKPSHIVLEPRDGGHTMARLIDAGIAGRIDTGAVFDLLGTPAYVSPEQVGGKLISFRSDLYALGCVMFEMLTGRPPFAGADVKATLEAHRTQELPALDVELPPAALSLLRSLLAKEPRQRPFSAQQVRRVLEPLLAHGTPLPAVSFRPAGASAPAKPAQSTTEELTLEELDLQEQVTGTVALPPEEVDLLEVHDSVPAGRVAPAAAAEPRVSTPQPAAVAAAAAAVQPAQAPAAAAPVPAEAPAAAAAAAAAPEAAAAGEIPPSRRSVDFDVESLFDDEVPAEPAAPPSLADTAPTQLYRRDEPLGAASPELRAAGPDPSAEEGPDPDATRVVARPTSGKRPPWMLMAGAAVVLLAIVLWARSGDDDEAAAGTAAVGTSQGAGAAAPPGAGEDDPSGVATGAAPQGEPRGSAGPAEGSGTAQAPTGGSTGQAPTAAAAQGGAGGAGGAPGAGAQPAGPAPSAQAGAAAVAQAAPTQPATAAPAGSQDPAVAPSGKVGSSAGSRISAQREPREDRVAKAKELKLEAAEHYKAGRYREAARAYERATELNPQDPGAFAGLGASLLGNNDAKGAIDAYSKAVRLQPTSSGFHAALGRAYLTRGDRGRARAAYEKALQLNPENGAAKTALAQLK